MKNLIILIGLGLWLLMLSIITAEAQTVIHQTIPGTNVRDYSAPSLIIQRDGTGYQTIPGTTVRDYSAPGVKVQRNNGLGYGMPQLQTPRLFVPYVDPYSD